MVFVVLVSTTESVLDCVFGLMHQKPWSKMNSILCISDSFGKLPKTVASNFILKTRQASKSWKLSGTKNLNFCTVKWDLPGGVTLPSPRVGLFYDSSMKRTSQQSLENLFNFMRSCQFQGNELSNDKICRNCSTKVLMFVGYRYNAIKELPIHWLVIKFQLQSRNS